MKRILFLLALFAAPAFADTVQSLNYNPATGQIQALTKANGTKPINGVGSATAVFNVPITETATTNTAGSGSTLNDLSVPTGVLFFNAIGNGTLGGVVAKPVGTRLTVYNEGSGVLTIPMNNGGSVATNRFQSGSGKNITVLNGSPATFVYIGNRWVLTSADFEQGQTCSFVMTGNTGGTTNWCFWSRNGRVINLITEISIGTLGGTGTDVNFGPLPYAGKTGSTQNLVGGLWLSGDNLNRAGTATAQSFRLSLGAGSFNPDFDTQVISTGVGSNVTNANLQNNSTLRFQLMYLTD